MIIKKGQKNNIFDLFKNLRQLYKLLIILCLFLICILSSTYFGIYLHKTGKTKNINGWVTGIYKNNLKFIPNYIRSFLITPHHLSIDIKFEDYQKIAHKRSIALTKGTLIPSSDDWVPAKITFNNKTFSVDMRLKGDVNDHWLKDDMWSYKIKVKKDETILGMKRFAIQSPETRSYLDEFIFHNLLKYSGLIYLRYDFINVSINGKNFPVYALEENFDKQLIGNNKLREGLIFQFEPLNTLANYKYNELMHSNIKPYAINSVAKNKVLSNQFERVISLIQLFRNGEIELDEVFDIKKLAKYFAIVELMGHHHSTDLTNIRFYYNPLTSLVEPVGYDNSAIYPLHLTGIKGQNRLVNVNSRAKNIHWYQALFNDLDFFSNYISELNRISKKSFLDDFFSAFAKDILNKIRILHKSYPWYSFEGEEIMYDNQKYIREILNASGYFNIYYYDYNEFDHTIKLQVKNRHKLPIEISGLIINDSLLINPRTKKIVQAESDPRLEYIYFNLDNHSIYENEIKDLYLNYKVLGASLTYNDKVLPWSYNHNPTNDGVVLNNKNISNFDFLKFDTENNQIIFNNGFHSIDEKIIIPPGNRLIINDSTSLDFINQSYIISYSPISFLGSKEHPLMIFSSDSSGQGIFVLNADSTSIIQNVIFNNLLSINNNNRSLTGAITLYNSPIKINETKFINIQSEDALNIISSEFSMTNTYFDNNAFDAFDCDFCLGEINYSFFTKTGNDAIDFSGSEVFLNNIVIDSAGDKSISIGEGSSISGTKVDIINSDLGITSKDKSTAIIDSVKIEDTRVALLVFQKKSEFGSSNLIVNNYVYKNVQTQFILEYGSKLSVNGNLFEPNNNEVRKIIY